MTGCNRWQEGVDIVVEGEAVRVTDDALLERLAETWTSKWDGRWQYEARDGCFHHEPGAAFVFRVVPDEILAFGRAWVADPPPIGSDASTCVRTPG